jgi:cohesin complex subunit SA-1/2
MFKKFRKHLSEFLMRLITAAAELQYLYSTDLVTTLQVWVIAMSSSQIRSFRHTATVVALELETALCEVAKAIEKEKELASRQIEGEKKRRTGKAATIREKDLDKRMKEVRNREAKVQEFLNEIIDG